MTSIIHIIPNDYSNDEEDQCESTTSVSHRSRSSTESVKSVQDQITSPTNTQSKRSYNKVRPVQQQQQQQQQQEVVVPLYHPHTSRVVAPKYMFHVPIPQVNHGTVVSTETIASSTPMTTNKGVKESERGFFYPSQQQPQPHQATRYISSPSMYYLSHEHCVAPSAAAVGHFPQYYKDTATTLSICATRSIGCVSNILKQEALALKARLVEVQKRMMMENSCGTNEMQSPNKKRRTAMGDSNDDTIVEDCHKEVHASEGTDYLSFSSYVRNDTSPNNDLVGDRNVSTSNGDNLGNAGDRNGENNSDTDDHYQIRGKGFMTLEENLSIRSQALRIKRISMLLKELNDIHGQLLTEIKHSAIACVMGENLEMSIS